MYLIKTKGKEKTLYILVVIDMTTNLRVKRYVNENIAKSLVNDGVKLYESVFQETNF